MSVLRLTRLTVDAARADEMLVRRAALIEAVRRTTDGLTDTKLARVDEETWLDVWRWTPARPSTGSRPRPPPSLRPRPRSPSYGTRRSSATTWWTSGRAG